MMEAFATPEQMAQRTKGAIPADTPFLEDELKAATRAIRDDCRWHIAPKQALTFRRVGPSREQVWLPAMQIEAIDSAIADGVVLDVATIEVDPDTGWTNIVGRSVTVEYRAGFPDVPDDLVTLTLELAAGGLGSPLGITREQAGGVSVTLARAGGGLMSADLARLTEYRIGRLP
jgi:hypothetical protein